MTRPRRTQPPGLVAFDGERAVGWVSLGPRTDFERIVRSRVIPTIDDRPVWSIVCFAVSSSARGQGVARALLDAARRPRPGSRRGGARGLPGSASATRARSTRTRRSPAPCRCSSGRASGRGRSRLGPVELPPAGGGAPGPATGRRPAPARHPRPCRKPRMMARTASPTMTTRIGSRPPAVVVGSPDPVAAV